MKNKLNLVVIQLPQDLNKEISTIRDTGFKQTKNPSFKMMDPYLMLGLYNGNKLPQYICNLNKPLDIDCKANLDNQLLYFSLKNAESLIELKRDLKIIDFEKLSKALVCNKHFPLDMILKEDKYPLIFLASNFTTKTTAYNLKSDYQIKDVRLNLLEVEFNDLGINYSVLDYRHLSNDK